MAKLSATLVRWIKADGERVFADEPICELENEFANADLPAWTSGVLRHLAKEGSKVDNTNSIARIEPIESNR